MKEYGYIRVPRTIDTWRWYKVANTYRLYMHLLLVANYVDGCFESQIIKRGQYVTSLKHLCDDLGMSLQELRTAIKHLKSTNEITIETTSRYSIFTVNDYEKFAASTYTSTNNQQTNNKQTTNEQQQYNKVNKVNKGINNTRTRERNCNSTFSIEDFEAKSLFKD